jgi:hypothetical protein
MIDNHGVQMHPFFLYLICTFVQGCDNILLYSYSRKEVNKMTKETLIDNILGSSDVQEILCIKRVRLKEFVDEGRLKPIKALKRELLFWKPDVDELKKEMMKDKRTNLYKQGEQKHA